MKVVTRQKPVLYGLGALTLGVLLLAGALALRSAGSDSESPQADAAIDSTRVVNGSVSPIPSTGEPQRMGETIAGIPVQSLSVGAPFPFPANVVAYYVPSGYGKEGASGLVRVYRDSGGRLQQDDLLQGELAKAYTSALNLEEGEVGVGVCEKPGTCGSPYFAASADSIATGYVSLDGGLSYASIGRLPPNALAHAVAGGELLVGIYKPGTVEAPTFEWLPSGRSVAPPVPLATPVILPKAGLVWLTDDGAVYGRDGTLLRPPERFGQRGGLPQSWVRPFALETWHKVSPGGSPGTEAWSWYVGLLDATGGPARIFSFHDEVRPITQLSDVIVIGNFLADSRSLAFPAMILNLDTGVIHPIDELTAALRAEGSRAEPFIRAALPGPVARVSSAGDCLNVRESASTGASSIGCFKDGVLLQTLGRTQEVDGIAWVQVRTPSGQTGWASQQFLK